MYKRCQNLHESVVKAIVGFIITGLLKVGKLATNRPKTVIFLNILTCCLLFTPAIFFLKQTVTCILVKQNSLCFLFFLKKVPYTHHLFKISCLKNLFMLNDYWDKSVWQNILEKKAIFLFWNNFVFIFWSNFFFSKLTKVNIVKFLKLWIFLFDFQVKFWNSLEGSPPCIFLKAIILKKRL